MPFSLYSASVPVFEQMLGSLSGVLDKAAAHCAAKKIDPAVLVATRLIPDMLPLSRQVQTASDFAKNASARLTGTEAPKFEDNETTLDELQARVGRTLEFLKSIKADQMDPEREVPFSLGPNKMRMPAAAYLLHMVLPNFLFHTTTAYAILRQAGVDIGKRDFMGQVPDLKPA